MASVDLSSGQKEWSVVVFKRLLEWGEISERYQLVLEVEAFGGRRPIRVGVWGGQRGELHHNVPGVGEKASGVIIRVLPEGNRA